MLFLIVSDGNQIRLIKQNIPRHQHRVCIQTGIDIVGMLCTLVLELSHPVQLAHICVAGKHPIHLSMLMHITLDENGRSCRINTACNKQCGHPEGTLKQELGILPDGQSVHIGNAIIAEFVITLKKLPIAQRPDVIAQSWYAARLNAAQDNLFFHDSNPPCLYFYNYT